MRNHWLQLLFLTPFVVGQFGFDFGDLGDVLAGYIQAFLSFLLQIIVFIWNVLVYVVNAIVGAFNFLGNYTVTMFTDNGGILSTIWNKVILKTLTTLAADLIALIAWIKKKLQPILDLLTRIRKWLDDAFNKYMKPVLVMIQNLRKFLQIFRLLGFKWAARLDALLGKIQADILKAYELVRQNLNRLTSWVQLIVDPTGLLRRNPLFGYLLKHRGELNNVALQTLHSTPTPDEVAAEDEAGQRYAPSNIKQRQQTYYANGILPDDAQVSLDDFRQQASDYLNS